MSICVGLPFGCSGVDACYYEPGMGFCGRWTSDSGDDYYNIEGDSDWVVENIPPYINEMFDISGNMEMWEDEYEDTETEE